VWVVGWIGLGCELAGIGIALWGLDELSGELFPGRPLPHRAAWRWTKRRLGIKPAGRLVQLEGTASSMGLAGSARLLVTKGRPSEAASLAEWNAYWDSRLENLSDQITWLHQDTKEANDRLAKRLEAESTERHAGDARLEERLTVVIGGEGGSGLAKTWWGLAITFVGSLLQGLAQGLG
jgi:hypothetical protein